MQNKISKFTFLYKITFLTMFIIHQTYSNFTSQLNITIINFSDVNVYFNYYTYFNNIKHCKTDLLNHFLFGKFCFDVYTHKSICLKK